jgi:hypothetical protein
MFEKEDFFGLSEVNNLFFAEVNNRGLRLMTKPSINTIGKQFLMRR